MKKICYITTISITIKTFFIKQLQYLSKNEFDVTVVCSPDSELQSLLEPQIRYIPVEIPRGISVGGSLIAIRKLIALFRKEKFDLIQYSTPNAAFYASIASKAVRCKVRNYHLMGFRYLGAVGMRRAILKRIEKIACRNSTNIECVSLSNLEIGISEKIFPREKAGVVWNGSSGGVDLVRFNADYREAYRAEIRGKYCITESEFVYGFVGRLTRDKGINEILEAFYEIENAKLLMVGAPEGIETLNQLVYKDSLENVNIIYTGNILEVEKYFAAIDVLLLPSYREGFGNVIIEAAAMGTPAIVSDIPGPIDAIIKDKTALVVEPRNVDSLLKAMQKMKNQDLHKMGEEAANFAKTHFDSVVLCEKVLERKCFLMQFDNEFTYS